MSSATIEAASETLGKAYDARLMRRLWPFIRPHRNLLLLGLAILLLLGAVQLVQPYLIKRAIDEQIAVRRLDGLGQLALWFLLALGAEFGLRYAQLLVLERAGQAVIHDLRCTIFAQLQRLPAAFFDRNPVGRLITHLTSDVEALNEAFTSGLVLIVAEFVKLVGIVVVLLWLDVRLALVTFLIVPPMLIFSFWIRRRLRLAYREIRALVARINAALQENVAGMRVVQLFGRERDQAEQFGQLNDEHKQAELRGVRYDSVFSAAAELMAAVTIAALIWFGGGRVVLGAITFGTLVAFIEYAGKFFAPLQELSQRYTVMQAAMVAAERIFRLLDTAAEPAGPKLVGGDRLVSRGEIRFERVHFAYDADKEVLHDVSFRIAPGERIAVVGWTGAGKSTLIRLLVRLYDPQSGSITLDGTDIRELPVSELRRTIGVVLQDNFLFAGTVASNISLDDPLIDADRVRWAARAVGADRFIEAWPQRYDEPIHERGANLSVGEKQLICFARALAFDPAVLVLDEATASIDPASEATVLRALARLMTDRTSIVIAHRLATIQNADRVLVLHKGRLAEQGTATELLQRGDGIYRALHTLQFGP